MNLKRLLLALAALCLSPSLWATTYLYTGAPYTAVLNFTNPCATGPCANYALGEKISGQFTTAAPLAANLVNQNIYPMFTSYSFTDGINTYSSGNANSRVYQFQVSTDAGGNVTLGAADSLIIELWQTGSNPHSAGNRVATSEIFPSGDLSFNNFNCALLGTSPFTGVLDNCAGAIADASSSQGASSAPGTWSILQAGVPTLAVPILSEWAMILLSLLVSGVALRALSVRRRASVT